MRRLRVRDLDIHALVERLRRKQAERREQDWRGRAERAGLCIDPIRDENGDWMQGHWVRPPGAEEDGSDQS